MRAGRLAVTVTVGSVVVPRVVPRGELVVIDLQGAGVTSVDTQPRGSSAPGGGAAPPVAAQEVEPVKPRRNMRLVLLGVALAVVFALLAVWAVNRAGESRSVVVVAKDIAAGDRVSASDLGRTTIRGGEDLSTVPGNDLRSLVGRRAARPLPAGSLVNEEAFARRVVPRSGDVIVPVRVGPGRYPASGLAQGDRVRVVVTGGQSSEELAPGTSFPGVVLAVGSKDAKGAMTVDVSIGSGDADLAAAAAGGGDVVIVNAAPGGTGLEG